MSYVADDVVRMPGPRLASFFSPPLLMDAFGCDIAWSPPRQLCLLFVADVVGCDDSWRPPRQLCLLFVADVVGCDDS